MSENQDVMVTETISDADWFDWDNQQKAILTRVMCQINAGNNPMRVICPVDGYTFSRMEALRGEIAVEYVGECALFPRSNGGVFVAFREYARG